MYIINLLSSAVNASGVAGVATSEMGGSMVTMPYESALPPGTKFSTWGMGAGFRRDP